MKQLVYVADPMCSWCWGFQPQLQKLQSTFVDRLPIIPVMGGLRAGATEPMTPELKEAVRAHWLHVAEATGQPFDHAFFDRPDYVYDTEPACRAVVTVRTLRPEVALMYFGTVQQAFYAEGRDVTRTDELTACAAAIGLPPEDFLAAFEADSAREAVTRDFLITQRLGVDGFPALFAEQIGHDPVQLVAGYRPLDGLIPALENWLA